MTTFLVVVNLVITLALVIGLYYMQRKHVSFSKRVFAALGIGIVFGLILQFIYGAKPDVIGQSIDWINIIGYGFVDLLKMLIMPLVFISILIAFTRTQHSKNIGKIGASVIIVLLGTTAIAAFIGIMSSLALDVQAPNIVQGQDEIARAQELDQGLNNIKDMTAPQKILTLFPTNPFADLTGVRPTSTIAVVIFSAFLGIAFLGVKRKQPEHAELFEKMAESIYSVVMRVVTLVLRLTPFGVFALITKVGATSDLYAIWELGKFVIALYIALIVMFLIHLLFIALFGLNPLTYVRKVMPVLTFAFTSRSSAGTLPLNVETQEKKLGVPTGIANFAGSFGLTIGQNGCAGIYPAMLAMMIAPTVGIDVTDPSFIMKLIVVVALSSFGVAGVGGGATFASLIVLSTMNLPIAIVALLISVEPLIDMGRTALNVSDGMLAGLLTGKAMKELDTKVYASKVSDDVLSDVAI